MSDSKLMGNSNANVAGMSKDLKIDDAQYQWLLTIFYISYILVGCDAIYHA